jgi:hypothetical protein
LGCRNCTLRGVYFGQVSAAAIAAALPRLHTLTAYGCNSAVAVAGFFTDLLPRLRVFHFDGQWPVEGEEIDALIPPSLPLLEELVWVQTDLQPTVFRRFVGARPIKLRAAYKLIIDIIRWSLLEGDAPECSMFASLCELHALKIFPYFPVSISSVVRVLRAAPQLQTFRVDPYLGGDTLWLTASNAPLDAAVVGLVHPRLQHFSVNARISLSRDASCASRLRQVCFPALRVLKVGRGTFSARCPKPGAGVRPTLP